MRSKEKKAVKYVVKLLGEEPTNAILQELKKHDEYTYRHSVNVAIYACMLVNEMSLVLKRDTVLGALLHDIGKIDIPSKVLKKPTALTKAEIELLKKHPLYSYQILDDRNFPSFVKEIGLLHHEKIDGSGYPSGVNLQNENIQIISICDMYDAMTTDRPYHHKFSHDKAFLNLTEDALSGKINKEYLSFLTTQAEHGMSSLIEADEQKIGTITFNDAREVFEFVSLCEKEKFRVHLYNKMESADAKSLISVCRLSNFNNLNIVAGPVTEDSFAAFKEKISLLSAHSEINKHTGKIFITYLNEKDAKAEVTND